MFIQTPIYSDIYLVYNQEYKYIRIFIWFIIRNINIFGYSFDWFCTLPLYWDIHSMGKTIFTAPCHNTILLCLFRCYWNIILFLGNGIQPTPSHSDCNTASTVKRHNLRSKMKKKKKSFILFAVTTDNISIVPQ